MTGTLAFSRCLLMPPPPWPVGAWTPIDFSFVEGTTDPSHVITGVNWRWYSLQVSFVHLLCSMQIQRVAGDPLWQLRVMRNGGMEETIIDAKGYTAQIAWIGRLAPQESLHVEIRPLTGPPVLFDSGSPRSSIVLHGYQSP